VPFFRQVIQVIDEFVRDVESEVGDWLRIASPEAQDEIRAAIEEELKGGRETGLHPFLREYVAMLRHLWGVAVGQPASS
jgi:hypothetical protein